MKGLKYILLGVVLVLVLLSTTGSLGSIEVNNKNPSSTGALLEVTTDKKMYNQGELVTIFLTNIGDEILSGGGPIVTIYNKNDEIVYQEACYCWVELEPGECIDWWPPWDQTDLYGNQVPVGRYVVEGFLSGSEEDYIDTYTFYIVNLHFIPAEKIVIP